MNGLSILGWSLWADPWLCSDQIDAWLYTLEKRTKQIQTNPKIFWEIDLTFAIMICIQSLLIPSLPIEEIAKYTAGADDRVVSKIEIFDLDMKL